MGSIRKQMLIYLLIGSIVIFSLLFLVFNLKLKSLPEHSREQYEEIVKARADEVSKELKLAIGQICVISNSPIIQSMDLARIKEYLPNLILNSNYKSLTIAYPDGQAWGTKDKEFNIKDQEQYRKIFLENKEYHISQPFRSPFVYEDENEIIVVAHRIVGEDGGTVGLVNGTLQVSSLNKIVSDLDLNGNAYGWIINEKGTIVAHHDQDIAFQRSIKEYIESDEALIDKIYENQTGVINYTGADGNKMLAFFTGIKYSPNWKFIVSVPEKEIYKKVNELRYTMALVFVLGLSSIIVFAAIYSRSLSKPIMDLKNVFEKAANGNFEVVANEAIPNELGNAATSFNRMLGQIKELTYGDPVTRSYNYSGFLYELPSKKELLRKKGQIVGISIISIDDFKRINSIYGYEMGDEVLRLFTNRLKEFIDEDELVARFLGDEFILLLGAETRGELECKVKDLWKISSTELIVGGNEFVLKTSVGASIKEEDIYSIEEIINQATVAKLIAKKAGGNSCKFYDEELDKMVREEQKIENALHHAIENNELRLVYQPIIDLNHRKIVAVEALLRWTHPKYQNISPLFMIRIAEESGIINDIGEWVLKEACKQNKIWQDKGLAHIKVSVNVSAMQFEQEDFVATVEEVLFETGMDPKYLELEITETNIMDNVVEKMDKMKELKDLGISISIDDFGTGYSSLAYFTRFPIDTLKIDKSFISGMLKDENSETIVKTIINMGKSINLKLVAEGVETEEQLERLEEMGCDKIQGYLISKPLESKKIVELFN